MKLQDDIDFTTLNWVKAELDQTLDQARIALEAYVEEPARVEQMRLCAANLHQVQGTLRMVELYGAAMVVEEMERLADGVLADSIGQRDEAYTVLMRGIVQLPDYLERLQGGHRDIPIVLLPLLNDLRACRGEKLLSESVLFAPDLSAVLPASASGSASPVPVQELRAQVLRLRLAFQAALLKWFRDESGGRQHPDRLLDILDRLRALSHTPESRELWWVAAGVIEAVRDGTLEASVTVKLLFGRVDRAIRRFAETGELAQRAAQSHELVQNLLYYIAHSSSDGARAGEIRRHYRLDELLPTQNEIEHAQGSLGGRNRNLLGTVSAAIKDDLIRVKESLDLFLRARDADPAQLLDQAEILDRVGDTLGMLGLGVPRRVVGEQREIIESIAGGQRSAAEDVLLDVAGALLYVEASLDEHIERLGAGNESLPREGSLDLPRTEVRKLLGSLMQEAAVNLHQAKQSIIAFIESPWDHDKVEPIPHLLGEVSGALSMLGLDEAATLMGGLVRFVEIELIHHNRVPTAEQMDALADAIASIEYYLEATREQRGGRERILGVTRDSLTQLGYWPVPDGMDLIARAATDASTPEADNGEVHLPSAATHGAEHGAFPSWGEHLPSGRNEGLRVEVDAMADDADDLPSIDLPAIDAPFVDAPPLAEHEAERDPKSELTSAIDIADGLDLSDLVVGDASAHEAPAHDLTGLRLAGTTATSADAGWIEVEEETERSVPIYGPDDVRFNAVEDGEIDDDIREVFVEEAEEELVRLRDQSLAWKEDSENPEHLRTIRRSFHTLKGSGRLVGAQLLGEFSWKVENMLNRVLDGSVPSSAAVVALVDHAIDALPGFIAALKGRDEPLADIDGIMSTAEQLAEGASAWLPEQPRMRTVRHVVRRRVPATQATTASIADDVERVQRLTDEFADDGAALATPIDPVLREILGNEIAMHATVIENWLAACAQEPIVPTEPVVRAVHTLHGAISMVDIAAVVEVLAPLETYVKRLRAASNSPDAEGLAAFAECIDVLRTTMARIDSAGGDAPDRSDLAARIVALRDAQPDLSASASLAQPVDLDRDAEHGAEVDAVAGAFDESAPTGAIDADRADAKSLHDEAVATTGSAFDAEAETRSGTDADAETDPDEESDGSATIAPAATADADSAVSVDDPTAALVDHFNSLAELGMPAVESTSAGQVAADDADDADEPIADTHDAGQAAMETPSVDPESPDDPIETFGAVEPGVDDLRDVALTAAGPERIDADAPDGLAAPRENAAAVALRNMPAPAEFPDDRQPEGRLDLPDFDEELLEIFVQEGNDILDDADAQMARMRAAPDEHDAIAGLQRDLHTLKGGARMAGLTPIGDLAHAMESLLEAISDGRRGVDRAGVESLEGGFDRLHDLLQRVAHHQAIGMPERAIARFAELVADDTSDPPRDAPEEPASLPPPRPMPAFDIEEAAHAPQEMIRVRSDLLDSLVNYAGEVSIYRSRLEQQISSFRFNLVELEQTVARLRDQLRMLEIETEAQIIARYQREHEGHTTFDPLELDRFSQLQQYSRALGESVSDLVSLQNLLDDQTRQSETLLLQQSRVSSDLQEGLMRTRMVPFDSMVPSLRRTVRQAAQELGKRAQLRVEGAQGEMDRNLLERMKAPFEHMLRNAIAHGIEIPSTREAAGKPEEGTVSIAVSREATEVVLRISDDGAGLDREAIRAKAIERGLLKPDVVLPDRDLYGFVLETGFSTAGEVSQLSGRGVGMDVVHTEIKQIGGSLQIDSKPGGGAEFTVRLPFTLAVTQAILVRVGEAVHAIPMSTVQGVARITREDLDRRIAAGDMTYSYGGEDYTIYELAQLLGVAPTRLPDEMQLPMLMIRTGERRVAVRIDAVVGSREIVVKSVGPQVSLVPGIFGATIMGDGSVLMILDLAPLVRRIEALREAGGDIVYAPPAPPERRRQPLVMVVDDSITMRKVTTRVLERAELDVVTAKDGLDAVEKLQDRIPDLMLLDIEMPRMDGYELATYMKNDARLKSVPIIMVTSRTGEKHRQRALEIGVERYLGKPYQELDLLQQVQETLEAAHA